VEEALSDDPLEVLDLLADCRLRVPELAGTGAERARARHGFERGEMAELDPEPLITIHDRIESELDLL
jgi:hypothetical protein